MGKGMNFLDAPPSRKPTRKKKGINTGKVVGTTMRGLGMLARGGGQAVRSGTGAIRARQAKSRRYVELREKARRYGFKNLSHDEKKEYSSEAMSRGHNIEG